MNALVVGLGRMGAFHAKVLRDLGYTVHTVDPDPEKDADYPTIAEARLAASPLSGFKYDVAAIATPAEHLLDSAYQLAGLPMLVEKPFALTSQSAWMLAAYLKQAGAPVCVGYVERFNPVVRDLRDRIYRLNRERPIRHVQFTRWSDRASWNESLDLLTHDIDITRELHIPEGATVDYDTRSGLPAKSRTITLIHEGNTETVFDLMDHSLSPLHALWHAFLTSQPVPTPEQAARVLQVIESMDRSEQPLAA